MSAAAKGIFIYLQPFHSIVSVILGSDRRPPLFSRNRVIDTVGA